MNDIIKIASRNITRNKRRTFLTVAIMTLGIIVYIFGMGYMDGIIESAFERSRKMTGEIRMTHKDFELKEKTRDLRANVSYDQVKGIEDQKNILYANKRIRFGGVIFFKDKERNAMGVGIEKGDLDVFEMSSSLIKGKLEDFQKQGKALVGVELAKKLDIGIGDSFTVMTSTQYESISAQNYNVAGIINDRNPALNQIFFINLDDAQYLLDMDGAFTEMALFLKDIKLKDQTVVNLKENYKELDIKAWNKIGINNQMDSWMKITEVVFLLIFGVLAAIGILNTMMMIVFERRREMGVLESMGMRKKEILSMMTLEGLVMGIIGTILGIVFGVVITYYFQVHGIDYGEATKDIMAEYNMDTVIYPLVKVKNLIVSIFIGIVFSFIGALLPVLPQLKKNPAELLKKS